MSGFVNSSPTDRAFAGCWHPWAQTSLPLAAATAAVTAYAPLASQMGYGELGAPVMLAILAASTVSSTVGFAFSALCGALLFHLVRDPVQAVQILTGCSIAVQSLNVWSLRGSVDWRSLSRLLAGGLVSMPFGVYLLLHLHHAAYPKFLGLFLIAYGVFTAFRRPPVIRSGQGIGDVAAGVLGGLAGGLAGFPGAFATMWCGCKGWDRGRQRAVVQPFSLIMQVATFCAIQLAAPRGPHGVSIGPEIAACAIPALLGTWCGLSLFRVMTERQFAVARNALLVAAGAGLVV